MTVNYMHELSAPYKVSVELVILAPRVSNISPFGVISVAQREAYLF